MKFRPIEGCMTDFLDIEAFRSAASKGEPSSGAVRRFVVADPETVEGETRTLRWVFSDGSVDRMTDTIDPAGWQLDRYKSNPVILWAHDSEAPPIGMATAIGVQGKRLVGDVRFADAETYEFADTIFRLVQGKFIRAGSVGFLPLEWKFAADKSRPNGIDFKRQELLEFSICPIPANPNALNEARSMGIDTRPLVGWAEKILDGGGSVLVPRAELDALRKAAAEPRARPKKAIVPGVVKDLANVAWLAQLLQSLSFLEDCVEWETEAEGDDSPIADRLASVVQSLGQILVDMTAEEVAELIGEEADDPDAMDIVSMSAYTPGQKAVVALARAGRREIVERSGRVLSKKNQADMQQARDLIDGVLQLVADDEPDQDEQKAVATRLRRAAALKRRHAYPV
jgi:hypothetical protein